MPSFLRSEFKWPGTGLSAEYSAAVRRSIVLRREPRNSFESFLQERISRDLLEIVVESFAQIRERAAAVRLRPKVVLTSNAHWFNDLFKHWVAEKVHEGVRLVVMEHGGALPPQFGPMDFEEDIADVKTTWALPYHAKHVRLPANKLVGRRRPARGERLVVVGSEMPRYAFAAGSTPIAGQTLLGFEYVCRLHDALAETPRGALLVKPYADYGWCLRERFVERLGSAKVAVQPRLEKVMDCARMVVCTYPQTTFAEALSRRIPTLLVYPRRFWETVERFDALIRELNAARMLFFDPEIAARHINDVWADPVAWWESRETKAARRHFEEQAVDLRPDWIEPWCAFVERMRAGETPSLPTGSQQHPRVS
jgi:putative transferase (TIGR04331 family)